MPNWVTNTITVTGLSEDLARFKEHIDKQPEYATDDNAGFSFHSFITLPPGTDKEVYLGTHGTVNGQQVGLESVNWYNWNMSNWNTKWDACEGDITMAKDPGGYEVRAIYISFNTAWSPPQPVFEAMAAMFPDLSFYVWYEEEQGWGGEFRITKGNIVTDDRVWDIPESHADYMDQGKDCVCSWEENKTHWYDDCPGRFNSIFTVEVVTKMYIKANTEEEAIEAAKAEESGYDVPAYTQVRKVLYAEEYRVTDKEQEQVEDD